MRLTTVAGVLLLVAACTPVPRPQPAATTPAAPPPSSGCRQESLRTAQPGRLTWAARHPGYAPWVIGDPAGGRGYEAAVAAAVTRRLGFPTNRTAWVPGTRNAMLVGGSKEFDVGFDQVVITPERGTTVDFSPSYYDVRQAVVAIDGNPAVRSATTGADLAPARLGAHAGSAALGSITTTIHPTVPPRAFSSSNDAKNALTAGAIDALVVDLPTAYYLTTVELKGTRIVGTLPQTTPEPERFGLVLQLDSPLTACVAWAVTSMRRDGTLDRLESAWLSNADAPPL